MKGGLAGLSPWETPSVSIFCTGQIFPKKFLHVSWRALLVWLPEFWDTRGERKLGGSWSQYLMCKLRLNFFISHGVPLATALLGRQGAVRCSVAHKVYLPLSLLALNSPVEANCHLPFQRYLIPLIPEVWGIFLCHKLVCFLAFPLLTQNLAF